MEGERKRVTVREGGELMTKQAPKAETDINEILRGWLVNRGPVPGNGREPRYGDFTGLGDYHQAVEQIRTAEEEFSKLPSKVRDRCKNDPGEFLAIVFSPERTEEFEELRSLGLAEHELPMAVRLSDEQVSELAGKLREAASVPEASEEV